jgi:hypothetical protein
LTTPDRPTAPTAAPLEIPEDALAAFLAGGDPPDEVPPAPQDPPAPVDDPEVPKEDEAPAEEPAKEEEAPPEKPVEPASRAALKLMRREAALREREGALTAREADLVAREAAVREAGAAKPGVEQLVRQAKLDPVGFVRALGIDVGVYGRLLLAEHLGDKAPEAYRGAAAAHRERTEVVSELDQLKETLRQMQAASTAAAYQAQMAATATQYVSGDLKDVPHVAKLVARKGAGVVADQILQEIRSDAAARIQIEGPNARALTPAQAAKRIHDRIADLLGDAAEPQTAKKTTGATKPVTSATNETTRTAPGRNAVDDDAAVLARALAEFTA